MRSFLLSFALLPAAAVAYIGQLCYDGAAGTCQYTSWCSNRNGISVPGYCPGPTDVQCCFYPDCHGGDGYCESDYESCNGYFLSGYCPGPTHMRCCI